MNNITRLLNCNTSDKKNPDFNFADSVGINDDYSYGEIPDFVAPVLRYLHGAAQYYKYKFGAFLFYAAYKIEKFLRISRRQREKAIRWLVERGFLIVSKFRLNNTTKFEIDHTALQQLGIRLYMVPVDKKSEVIPTWNKDTHSLKEYIHMMSKKRSNPYNDLIIIKKESSKNYQEVLNSKEIPKPPECGEALYEKNSITDRLKTWISTKSAGKAIEVAQNLWRSRGGWVRKKP